MKIFLRNRSISFWLICCLAAILIIGFFAGFRISYNPMLDNNWSAIAAVANWFSALGALGAVAVTIIIALRQGKILEEQKNIAVRQNEITEAQLESQNKGYVFEKRLQAYYSIYSLYKKGREITKIKDLQDEEGKASYIVAVLFGLKSVELSLIKKMQKKAKNAPEQKILDVAMNEVREWLERNGYAVQEYYDSVIEDIELFYNKLIAEECKLITNKVLEIKLFLPVFSKEDVNDWIQDLNSILFNFEEDRILEMMREKLPH